MNICHEAREKLRQSARSRKTGRQSVCPPGLALALALAALTDSFSKIGSGFSRKKRKGKEEREVHPSILPDTRCNLQLFDEYQVGSWGHSETTRKMYRAGQKDGP